MTRQKVVLAGAVLVAGLAAQGAQAAMCSNPYNQLTPLCLTDTVANNGSSNYVTDPYGAPTAVNAASPTTSYFLGDQFDPGPVDANLTGVSGGGTWNFYDSFVFTLSSNAVAQGALLSFDLGPGLVGIGPLQARVVQVATGAPYPYNTNGDFDAVALSDLNNFGTTVIDGWTTDELSGGYYVVMLNQHALTGGEYVLQVRGLVAEGTGSANGSYSGTLSFVPLPPGIWLLLSGLGVLATWVLRRHRDTLPAPCEI
jgi:hypothetical protein